MRKYLILSIAGCVLLPSLASAEPGGRVARVSYADLNIADVQGQQTLDRRLTQAARAVCADNSSDPFVQLAAYRCKRKALANAREQMNQAVAARRAQSGALLASR